MPPRTLDEASELNIQTPEAPALSVAVLEAEPQHEPSQGQSSDSQHLEGSRFALDNSAPASSISQGSRSSNDVCTAQRACSLPCGSDARSVQSTTLVPSSPSSQANSNELRPPPQDSTGRSLSVQSLQNLRHRAPEKINTQTWLAWNIAALTIATVVYCIRADRMAIYNNELEFFQYCGSNDFSTLDCIDLIGKTPGMPPFSYLTRAKHQVSKRSNKIGESDAPIPVAMSQFGSPLQDCIVFLGVYWRTSIASLAGLTILAACTTFKRVANTHAGRTKISDTSMARQEPTSLSGAVTTGYHTQSLENASRRTSGRYRAFLPAEDAINRLKYANSSEASTLSTADSRRLSNPWDRSRSSLSVSDPSLFENADIYYYSNDSDSTKWQKVKRYSSSAESTENFTSTMKAGSPLRNELPTPPPTPPLETEPSGGPKGPMEKFRALWKLKPISVFDHPPPELHEGDSRAALAFVGAIIGAYAGGLAMSKCPVEVTPARGLPDSWMHTSPQDTMPTLLRMSTSNP